MKAIYRIVCFRTCSIYVGATEDFKRRKRQHLDDLKHGIHHNHRLQRAYSEYGLSAFYFEVIETVENTQADEREIYWVNYYDSYFNGFNLTFGGNKRYGLPYIIQNHYSMETKNAV